MSKITVLNPDDKNYSSRIYRVQLGYYLSFDGIIFASCEPDAIDLLIDAHDNDQHIEWFLNDYDFKHLQDYELEDYIYGGNYCKYMSFQYHELCITEISEKELDQLLASNEV